MDPNENLRVQLEIAARIIEFLGTLEQHGGVAIADLANDAESLAEHVRALDVWIRRGGFLPAQWCVERASFGKG